MMKLKLKNIVKYNNLEFSNNDVLLYMIVEPIAEEVSSENVQSNVISPKFRKIVMIIIILYIEDLVYFKDSVYRLLK
jgi:hypothetical protein